MRWNLASANLCLFVVIILGNTSSSYADGSNLTNQELRVLLDKTKGYINDFKKNQAEELDEDGERYYRLFLKIIHSNTKSLARHCNLKFNISEHKLQLMNIEIIYGVQYSYLGDNNLSRYNKLLRQCNSFLRKTAAGNPKRSQYLRNSLRLLIGSFGKWPKYK